MPTHGHGQGYTDINFVIPEFDEVDRISQRHVLRGDRQLLARRRGGHALPSARSNAPMVAIEGGPETATCAAWSPPRLEWAAATLLFGVDDAQIDGPWLLGRKLSSKRNGLLRYSMATPKTAHSALTAQGYEGEWRSTDQIPLRAVEFGSARSIRHDRSDGSQAIRIATALAAQRPTSIGGGQLKVIVVRGRLRPGSVFELSAYFTDSGATAISSSRSIDVASMAAIWVGPSVLDLLGQSRSTPDAGVQVRHDDIAKVGLYRTIE